MNSKENVSENQSEIDNALRIKKTDFEQAKQEIKNFSIEADHVYEFKPVSSNKTFMEFLSDAAIGKIGFTHNVTGKDLNDLMEVIQDHLSDVNANQIRIIKEFNSVYNAFDTLDSEYIAGIIESVNRSNQAINKVEIAQDNIEALYERLNSIVQVLKIHKEELEKISHLADTDRLWEEWEIFKNTASSPYMQEKRIAELENENKAIKAEMTRNKSWSRWSLVVSGCSLIGAAIAIILNIVG